MLTDAALKKLKSKDKVYKVTDRDGMYVLVSPSGNISFRLDYRLNGRRETVTFGRYGRDGLSLAHAREKCIDAKRAIREGRSPAIEKQREKRRIKEAKSFGQFGEKWLTAGLMADSTRAMRRSIFDMRRVYRKAGAEFDELGRSDGYGRLPVCCGAFEVSPRVLADMRRKIKIVEPLYRRQDCRSQSQKPRKAGSSWPLSTAAP